MAGGFRFTEGPVWVPSGSLLFSDIRANAVYRWKPGEGVAEFLSRSGYDGTDMPPDAPVGSNGLTIDGLGRLTLCEHGNRAVTRLENGGMRAVLAGRFEGKRLNSPNDCIYRSDGSLYFTDPPYGLLHRDDDAEKDLPFCGIYRWSQGRGPALHGAASPQRPRILPPMSGTCMFPTPIPHARSGCTSTCGRTAA